MGFTGFLCDTRERLGQILVILKTTDFVIHKVSLFQALLVNCHFTVG